MAQPLSLSVAFHSGFWHGNGQGQHSKKKAPICKCLTMSYLDHWPKQDSSPVQVLVGQEYISAWILEGMTHWMSLLNNLPRGPISYNCPKILEIVPSYKGWRVWIQSLKTFALCVLQGTLYLEDTLKGNTPLGYKRWLIASLTQDIHTSCHEQKWERENEQEKCEGDISG